MKQPTMYDLQAVRQALLDAQAELERTQPAADALHRYCAARLRRDCGREMLDAHAAMLQVHRATTPSEVPSSHVIVERARLERLEAIEKMASQWILADECAPEYAMGAADRLIALVKGDDQ